MELKQLTALNDLNGLRELYNDLMDKYEDEEFVIENLDNIFIIFHAVPRLSTEIEMLRQENRELKLQQYKWNCSGCGHFDKYLTRTCPSCGRQNYYSGSFKREDLEKWFDEQKEE